jgi:hypothetical protein
MILEMAIACFLDNAVKKSQKLTKKEIDLAVKRKKEHTIWPIILILALILTFF